MRPRELSWTHPPLRVQLAPLHLTCPAQWPADRRCGGGSVGDPIDSFRPCRWTFLEFALGSLEIWQWEFLQAGLVNYLLTCDWFQKSSMRPLHLWCAWNVLLRIRCCPLTACRAHCPLVHSLGCPSFRHVRRTLRKGSDGTLICVAAV